MESQYKIVEATIAADRFGGFDINTIDVRSLIAEFNVFESLEKPYLTGSVVILDDKSLFDAIQFQGTERLRIKMTSQDEEPNVVFERTFVMTGIERTRKANANATSSMYVFTLLDEHAFVGRINKISKSYRGSLETIMAKIAANEFKKDIDVSYSASAPSVQTDITCIVPNMTALDAIQWLNQRATTQTGSTFFTYASMHDDNIRIGNLDVMLQQDPFNSKLPYTYNPSNISQAENQGELEKTFTIKSLKTTKMGNSLNMIESGCVTASYANTNLNTGQIFSQRYSVRKQLEELEKKDIIGKNQNVFDGDFFVGDKQIDLYDAKRYHTVTSTGTYGRNKSYHDETDETKFRKKLEGKSLKRHLFKNMINVAVDGVGFIISKAGVGDIVRLNIVNDNTLTDDINDESEVLDKRLSGDFVIYDTRHTFSGTQHTVSMNVGKLEKMS